MCKEICKVFVSRKTSDKNVGKSIRRDLQKFAGSNLEFFDADDIEPGEGWRDRLRTELKDANLLFLVLTRPAKNDFDWPLYEAGLFEDLDQTERKKVVCFYPDPDKSNGYGEKLENGIPSQLGDKQAVKAEKGEVLRLLSRLFHNKKFTGTCQPLNKYVTEVDLDPIARTIVDRINGVEGEALTKFEYTNRFIQLGLDPSSKRLAPGNPITSDKETLREVFNLGEKPPDRKEWVWADVVERTKLDNDPMNFNLRWKGQLENAICAMRSGDRVRQLTARFLGKDGELYRPEIEVTRTYENGRMTVDVTFSRQVQDSWLRQAQPMVALAANLAVASRIRYELIDKYLRRVPRWLSKETIEEGCTELFQVFETVESEGFFVQRMTRNRLAEVFDVDETEELVEIQQDYEKDIRPRLVKALEKRDREGVKQALKGWSRNNCQFLNIALATYHSALAPPKMPKVRHLKKVVNQ